MHVRPFTCLQSEKASKEAVSNVWCKGVACMMAEFFVGLQKVFSSLFSVSCVIFWGDFFSLSFLQERATPVYLVFSPSAVSIPFDLRHPWEAWADLPQGSLL